MTEDERVTVDKDALDALIALVYGSAVLVWGLLIFAAGIGVGRQWEKERGQ